MEMDDHKRRRNLILYVLIAFAVYLVLSSVLFPNFRNGRGSRSKRYLL